MKYAFEKVLPPESLMQEFGGLRPRSWICVGAGFSREDVKAYLLAHDVSFTGEAVQTLPQLAQRIAGVEQTAVLGSPSRQEVLRLLLAQPGLREHFPELKRLKRQGTFLRKLDLAVQAGRMAFAHWEEAQVYSDRLSQKSGINPIRRELEILAQGYEVWLQEKNLWDPPAVLRAAVEKLGTTRLPAKIYYFSGRTQESLERSFWEALGHETELVCIGPKELGDDTRPEFRWQRWHTLDDAAESAADALVERVRGGQALTDAAILITDVSSVRRTVKRAVAHRGLELSDPRDPTRLRWDETIKWALLPLELVARGFERGKVVAFIENHVDATASEKAVWIREIMDRGVRDGLESYSGGKLALVHARLKKLGADLGGKRTAAELGEAHLRFISRAKGEAWILGFFEAIWSQLADDLVRVDLADRKAAPIYWLERLQSRVSEAPAPVERLKPAGGLDLYRLHQSPSRKYSKLYVFGMPANWLSGESVGDYWFSEREREILSAEFSVRSGMQVREERRQALDAWFSGAEEVIFLDAHYDPDGREREGILATLEELGVEAAAVECGSHPRWRQSYSALRPMPPTSAELPGLQPAGGEERPVFSASALENYSRCGFLALARHRWRLDDLQEPDFDLWPQIKGILLHEAVRFLVQARDESGNFAMSAEEAVEKAWAEKRPRGLLRGARIETYVKRKLVALLQVFQEQERKYVQRAGTKVLALEDVELRTDYPGFSIVGEPDRIDEHPDGIWIIDYKTSSSAPNGSVMLENGYRLQLPYYAIAAQKKFGKSALGFQFVQLDRKGTRTNGVYFKSHNGKEPGKLTQTTAASKSMLSVPRDEVWSRFEDEIQTLGAEYVSGRYEAKPRISPRVKECASCAVSDFCGYRRLLEETDEEGGANG